MLTATQIERTEPMAPKKDARQSYLQPSREGMKGLIAWIPEDDHRALKVAAAQRGMTMAEAVLEAVRSWTAKKGGKK